MKNLSSDGDHRYSGSQNYNIVYFFTNGYVTMFNIANHFHCLQRNHFAY